MRTRRIRHGTARDDPDLNAIASEPETKPSGDARMLARGESAGGLLWDAAKRVLDDVPSWAGDALDREDSATQLAEIVEAIQSADVRALRQEGAAGNFPLRRRLLDLLRSELVRTLSGEPDSTETDGLLDLLSRFELVRAALEPDWRQYFASAVSGTHGQDLIVEVAHDFRSPLTSIMFLAETLRRGQSGDVSEHQRHQLGIIYSAALGLASVASDVIEIVRGGEALAEQEPSPFSISEVLEGVRDMVRPMAEEKGLALQIVPPENPLRTGHPVPLSRALLNLTTNAIKFTDEGFVEVIARSRGDSAVEFSVRDTGRGVNAEALRTLYHPFRRARTEKGFNFSGTGLGLAICRKMIEAMDSELHLESEAGWGSRFWFQLEMPAP